MENEPIELELGDITYTLNPTLGAIKKINQHFTSLHDCSTRLMKHDFDAISFVIAAAAGLSAERTREMEKNLIGRMSQSLDALSRYLVLLMNGGIEPGEESEPGEA